MKPAQILAWAEAFRANSAGANWGDVGDLGYVIEKLREASDFIFQDGECAG